MFHMMEIFHLLFCKFLKLNAKPQKQKTLKVKPRDWHFRYGAGGTHGMQNCSEAEF